MSINVRKSVRDVRSRLKVESRERDTVTYYSDKDARRGRPKATRIPTERNFRCYGGKLINIIHQRITMRRHMHPQRFMRAIMRMLTSTDPRRTDDTARAICSATHARNTTKQTACMLCSQETCPSRPQAWDLAQGLAAARSQKSAQHGTRSARTMQGVCMGREGAHLLPLDADVEVRAVRMQRVWRPPAAGLTTCGAHRAASGATMPVQSGRSGPSSSKHANLPY